MEHESDSVTVGHDKKILHAMGFAPVQARRMRTFQNFANSYSIICINMHRLRRPELVWPGHRQRPRCGYWHRLAPMDGMIKRLQAQIAAAEAAIGER